MILISKFEEVHKVMMKSGKDLVLEICLNKHKKDNSGKNHDEISSKDEDKYLIIEEYEPKIDMFLRKFGETTCNKEVMEYNNVKKIENNEEDDDKRVNTLNN